MTNIEFLPPIRALCLEYGMLPRGGRVLLALSGGRDSMALLHALLALQEPFGFTLCAAHYNHRLRGEEAARDAAFAEKVCRDLGIPFLAGQGDVKQAAAQTGRGIEETARDMRYAFLEEAAAQLGAERIATAHHADDNVETMLLHLTRGTGLRGLGGIAPVRGKLIRPLLTTARAAVEAYVAKGQIPFVEDGTNQDTNLTRNRLRHEILPLLREINPQLTTAVTATIRGLREDEAFLEAQAMTAFRAAKRAEDGLVIEVKTLAGLPRAVALRVLRRMLAEIEAPPVGAVHLATVLVIANGQDPAAAVHLPGGVLVQRVYGDLLIAWDHLNEPLPPLEPLEITQMEGSFSCGDWTLRLRPCLCPSDAAAQKTMCYLSQAAIKLPMQLRARQTGDYLSLPGRCGKTLKKLMIEEKIPRRDRECVPVLADEAGLIAVAGLGPERTRLAKPGEQALALCFLEKDSGKDA